MDRLSPARSTSWLPITPMRYFGPCHMTELLDWTEHRGERVYTAATLPAFRQAVFSWNIGLEPGAGVHLRFAVRAAGSWSEPFDLALWSAGPERRSFPKQEQPAGVLDIDVFTAAPGTRPDGLRVWLRPTDSEAGYRADALLASLRLLEDEDRPASPQPEPAVSSARLQVPALVQFPVDGIGARICSPTSCAMLLATLGHTVSVRDLADAAWDGGADIYGNWSMNMAATARPGVRAYARHFEHIGQLAQRAAAGAATAISVRTAADQGFPGALQTYPSGHLMVVTGFEPGPEGSWSVLVNDPADHDVTTASRRYPLALVESYWNGVGYVVEPSAGPGLRTSL